MARTKTKGIARGTSQAAGDLELVLQETLADRRGKESSVGSNRHWRSSAGAIHFLLLLLIALCLPTVARSVHAPNGEIIISNSSGELGSGSSRGSDRRMQASIGASSLMRSLLANPSVPLELVPALRKALVAGTSEEVTMRNLPLGPLAGPPFAEEFEFVDWFGKPMESRERAPDESRLARVTTYWPEEGDRHTRRALSSTGVRLRDGHCAVDPRVIPYGSVVTIRGVGEFVAVDTGPAVVSRRAARQLGRNRQERSALVVDIFCSSRSKANAIEASLPEFAFITWSR